jgi:hypothetical protein
MDRNLFAVFGERDPERRAAASALTYTDDVLFVDPEESSVGRPELERRAQAILDKTPGFVFAHDGPLYASGDTAVLAWAYGPPGAPVVHGADVAFFRDGKICRLHTLFSAPAGAK